MKKNIIAMAIIISIFLGITSSCDKDNQLVGSLLTLDGQANHEGLLPSTIEEIKKSIEENKAIVEQIINAKKDNARFYKLLAIRYMDEKLYSDALLALQEAIALSPENSQLFYMAGLCASIKAKSELGIDSSQSLDLKEKYFAVAEKSYLRAISIDDNALALYGLSVLYVFELDRSQDAEKYIKRYLSKQTENIEARFILARIYYDANKLENAIAIYDEIIKISKYEDQIKEANANKESILAFMYGKGDDK